MQNFFARQSRRGLLLSLFVLSLIAAIVFTPSYFRTEAGKNEPADKTANRGGLGNYDIRRDKNQAAKDAIISFRAKAGKDAVAIADAKDEFVAAEKSLREEVPTLKIEYNPVIFSPEIITPVVNLKQDYLTAASTDDRTEILRRFIGENNELVGLDDNQPAELKVAADYTNADGNLSFVRLKQEINGVPVFQGEIKAGFTKRGEMIRVINNLAPGLNNQNVSDNFGEPSGAVKSAADYVNYQLKESDLARNEAVSNDLRTVFGSGDWATTAEKTYFPVEPGVARAAWGVLIWQPVNAFYTVVDAETGKLLWRKNLTAEQTQSATYNVYANSTSMLKTLDSPTAGTPGPSSPSGAAGAFLNRSDVALIGNEAPYTFNNLGWITDGGNATEGNNVIAGLDRNNTDGVDATVTGSGNRIFNFSYNPGPGNPAPGDAPLPGGSAPTPCVASPAATTDFQRGVVTQLFYITNRYHDEMYQLGFNEQAGNFQTNNFGRGGAGSDRVSAEAQDCKSTNNANFATPPDGFSGRMQMYLFTNPSPDRDGSLDSDVVVHELTHGLSNRLHGDAFGLSSNMAGGMGEGWSDFYALSLLSEASDPVEGVYPAGSYATNDAYHGIRRFPYAVKSSVGGASNRPHNPMTFADIDATQKNLSDGAFPPAFDNTADQVHNIGQVWATILWEVRARFVNRLGWQTGNRRFLQFVTDGMKLAPIDPTFLQERDAIIAAARAANIGGNSSPDVIDIWEGFRIRGVGFSAKITNPGTGGGDTRVVEAFDSPNVTLAANTPVSDASPGGDGDGYFEPSETLSLTVPVSNTSGAAINNVTVSVTGGGTVNYGNIADNQTVSQTVSYTVPANTACGSQLTITINVSSSVGQYAETRNIIIGQPSVTLTEKFDGVSAPALPSGWATTQTGAGTFWAATTAAADTAPNSVFVQNLGAAGGADLESPSFNISNSAATLKFRQNYDTESGWDGGVLEISINGGAYQDIIAAGGSFIEGGYNGSLGVNSNPLDGRAAWTGNSGGFITTSVLLPAAVKNQPVKFKWRFGQDTNTSEVGWYVDSLELIDTYSCSVMVTNIQATVGTNPAGLAFTVDGTTYTAAQTFTWASGSSHTITTTSPQGNSQTQYVWNNWSDGGAMTRTVSPTSNATYTANFTTQHFLTMNAGAGGTVSPQSGWYNAGQSVQITAAPNSGNIFSGWTGTGSGSYSGTNNPATVTINNPITETAAFSAQCSYSLNTASANIAAAGASGSFNIIAGTGCAWTAVSNAAWISASSSGSGNGAISYIVAANADSASRTGTISVGGQIFTVNQAGASIVNNQKSFDYDGDSKTDISIYRASLGQWWYLRSSDGANRAFAFGTSSDKIVPADYTGDGKTDIAFFRPSSGEWFILRSEDNSYYAFPFGQAGDIALAADFDGDGKADPTVFRPSTQVWYTVKSTGGNLIRQFGITGDLPVAADYDGDKRADVAIFRPGVAEWWIQKSTGGSLVYQFGAAGDKAVPADYTGDGSADVAFYRPSSGEWFVIRSENQSYYAAAFGQAGDVPIAGDYDGDGKSDFAVFRPATNVWYLNQSRDGNLILSFGQTGDTPTPNAFVP